MLGTLSVTDKRERQHKMIAAAGTAVLTFLLLLWLLLAYLTVPYPLPGEEGVAISFGAPDGSVQMPASRPTPQPTPVQPKVEETTLTQDFEEAPAIPEQPKPQRPKPQPEQPKPTPPTPTPVETPPQPTVNQAALFPGASPGEDAPKGDPQGKGERPDGSLEGQGTNPGAGSGIGSGGGQGISYSIGGRQALALPTPEYPAQKSGKVVVKVWVNQLGKVTKVEAGQPGSTTFDPALLRAARAAALLATFNQDVNSPQLQSGTITYNFQLKQ